jgi:hypothetical protein
MVGSHDVDGFLLVGIHEATWDEVVERFGSNRRRLLMLALLGEALAHFADAGCTVAYLGGSFVTTKEHPGDLDVVWDITGVDPSLVHPFFLIFDRAIVAAVHQRFAGHYFPSFLIEGASGMPYLQFFQQKDGRPVGIVKIDLTTLPAGGA